MVELGFSDSILERESAEAEDIGVLEVLMLYSRVAVTNSLMDKISAKSRIEKSEAKCINSGDTGGGRSVDEIRERLNFIKRFI